MKKIVLTLFVIFAFIPLVYAKDIQKDYHLEYLNIPFWSNFNDDLLIENLYKVYENNHDLKTATLKVSQAQKIVKMTFANELPSIGVNGYIGHVFHSSEELFGAAMSIPDYTQTRFLVPLTLNYELDIWGKNHLKTKSKKKSYEEMLQDEKSAYIYMTSVLAIDYYNLIKADILIEFQKQLINTQEDILQSVNNKYQLGTATISQVLFEERTLTYLKEELNSLLEKQEVLKNQIAVLVSDKETEEVKRSEFKNINPLIIIPESVKSELILSRPDCVKSSLDLERIGIDVKVAKREFLPTFNITGNLGFNMYNTSTASPFLANLFVQPSLDLFMGGRKIQYLKLKKDEYKIGLERYNKTILVSLQETNDALYTLKSVSNKHLLVKNRLDISNKEFGLVEVKAEFGTADRLNILQEKKINLLCRQQEAALKINEIISMINVYQALGGINLFDREKL